MLSRKLEMIQDAAVSRRWSILPTICLWGSIPEFLSGCTPLAFAHPSWPQGSGVILPITGGWIGGCQGMSTCKWAMQHLSPLLQSQFLTFEGYCPLLFVQLYQISARQCMISAKQPVCWLMPAFTSTSLLQLTLPFPGGGSMGSGP